MDLDECRKKGFIRKTIPNQELIKSILEVAQIKEEEVLKNKLTERNISAYLPLAYDSLRETMEAVCISKGYKVLNHVCIGELLKNELADDYFTFDRMRYAASTIMVKRLNLNRADHLYRKCSG